MDEMRGLGGLTSSGHSSASSAAKNVSREANLRRGN